VFKHGASFYIAWFTLSIQNLEVLFKQVPLRLDIPSILAIITPNRRAFSTALTGKSNLAEVDREAQLVA
jgi:hypothetical protein